MQNMNHPSQVLRLLFTCIIQAFSPAIQDLFRNIATAILLPARQPVNFRLGGHRLLPTLFRLPAPFRYFRHTSGTRHQAPSGTRLPGTPAPRRLRHPHYPKSDAVKMQHLQKAAKKDRRCTAENGPEGTVPHGPLGSSASYNSYIAFLLRLCYNT